MELSNKMMEYEDLFTLRHLYDINYSEGCPQNKKGCELEDLNGGLETAIHSVGSEDENDGREEVEEQEQWFLEFFDFGNHLKRSILN